MIKIIKQFFCFHEGICTTTKVHSTTPLLIVSTLIQCTRCEKTFAQHPNAQCCYVQHLHGEMIREQLFKEMDKFRQPL